MATDPVTDPVTDQDTDEVPVGTLRWVHEEDPRWDADRARVFATVPDGVFASGSPADGERLSSDWWRAERDGRVVGYGWLDDVWGDAEILLAVEEGARGTGVGGFVLARLEEEAAARGLNYVVNVVRDTHPQRAAVQAWFLARGFRGTEDGRLRKHVGEREPGAAGGAAAPRDDGRRARYAAERDRAAARPRPAGEDPAGDPAGADLGPGAEESGGYVDPERHRY
jgi:N-acetylglutamate synthase-like GNAT family acetyltransferase